MYDPNDVLDIDVEGFGRLRCRCLTERQVKEIARLSDLGRQSLEGHHEQLNKALAVGLVDFDAEGLTLAQKVRLVDKYPWAATNAELDRLKNPSASPSA